MGNLISSRTETTKIQDNCKNNVSNIIVGSESIRCNINNGEIDACQVQSLISGYFLLYDKSIQKNPIEIKQIVEKYFGDGKSTIQIKSNHKPRMFLINKILYPQSLLDFNNENKINYSIKYDSNHCKHSCYGGSGWLQVGLIGCESYQSLTEFCDDFVNINNNFPNMTFTRLYNLLKRKKYFKKDN